MQTKRVRLFRKNVFDRMLNRVISVKETELLVFSTCRFKASDYKAFSSASTYSTLFKNEIFNGVRANDEMNGVDVLGMVAEIQSAV